MVIPYLPRNGDGPYARVKLDTPGPAGKRYRSPSGKPNRLYIPALLLPEILADPDVGLWITEGEKKSLAACQAGLPCIAVAGVWSWRTKRTPKGSETVPVPDLDHITWTG